MVITKRQEWSKSYGHVPRDNILPHALSKSQQFTASYSSDVCPPPMNLLLAWEYGRIWIKERDVFAADRAVKNKPKIIKNDFKKWLEGRKHDKYACPLQKKNIK